MKYYWIIIINILKNILNFLIRYIVRSIDMPFIDQKDIENIIWIISIKILIKINSRIEHVRYIFYGKL